MKTFKVKVYQILEQDNREYTTVFDLLDSQDYITFKNEFEDFHKIEILNETI